MRSERDGVVIRLAADGAILADLLVLCVNLTASPEELAAWWREPRHQAAMKLLPPAELDRVVAAKDLRKMAFSFGS